MKFVSSVSHSLSHLLSSRALNYGDGVFETMSAVNGKIPLWEFHWQRLNEGLQRLRIDPPQLSVIKKQIAKITSNSGHEVVKMVLWRSGESKGYLSENSSVEYYITARPQKKNDCAPVLTLSSVSLSNQPLLAGIKHLNRLEQVLATQQLIGTNYEDCLICDTNGNVIETSCKNIVFIKGDSMYSPELKDCGVYGVALRWLKEQCLGLRFQRIHINELSQFETMLVCNSVQGFAKIDKIDERFVFSNSSSLINKIQNKWQEVFTC